MCVFQEHTCVGSANSQDIQLCGMAIQAEHCVIDVTLTNGVMLTPHRNARYVSNSKSLLWISSKVQTIYHATFCHLT